MLEVGPANENGESGEAADLAVFVDRLAAASADRLTATARVQIRRAILNGTAPPGIRRLAEALAASVDRAERARPGATPSPLRPAGSSATVAAAVRANTLVVLEDFDVHSLADAVDRLLADGKRVVITGADQQDWDQLRLALPAGTAGRVLDELPALGAGELRELRSLLATSTPIRRARSAQQLPAITDLPSPAEVAQLCEQAQRSTEPSPGAAMVPRLLAEVDPARRAAVTSVAQLVDRSLRALPTTAETRWAWRLLSDLVLAQHRTVFEGMLEDTAQAVAAVDHSRNAAPVTFPAQPDAGVLSLLRQYRDFLAGGGRCRTYFRSSLQREVQPVLGAIRVDGRAPETEADVQRAVEYLELGEWLRRVCAGCVEMGIPAPRDDVGLRRLSDVLLRVAAAVRSVSALRHDVLFLAADSPLSVPDVESAANVAAAVLDFERNNTGVDAGRRLYEMADRLAGRCPITAMSPEHERVCTALRARDVAGYADAVESLVAARREQRDEERRTTLLLRLGAVAPRLAAAWSALADHSPAALGMAIFLPMEQLLAQIPPPDSADVLLVLGADALGVEHLLLTAAAPRMLAAIGSGERAGSAPSLLSVLRRADALLIRSKNPSPPPAAVVPISAAAQPRATRAAAMGQAGA